MATPDPAHPPLPSPTLPSPESAVFPSADNDPNNDVPPFRHNDDAHCAVNLAAYPNAIHHVGTSPSRSGRHSRFTPDEDLIIVREVAASKGHIAAFGSTRKRFAAAAQAVNDNTAMRTSVTWKSVQDRYKRLQEVFDREDNANKVLSGVSGGAMGELDELLMGMREARDDLDAHKKAEHMERRAMDEAKERAGLALVDAATTRRSEEDDEVAEVVDGTSASGSGRKKRRINLGFGDTGDIDQFGLHLKEADMERVALERERLCFEKDRYETERQERKEERVERRAERAEERTERREDRDAGAKQDLEKFKLMMQAFLNK